MEFIYPEHVYTDVRIEHVYATKVSFLMGDLSECKETRYSAAFIRVFDGSRWYNASTTDICAIQAEIDRLACLTDPSGALEQNKIYPHLSQEVAEVMTFTGKEASKISLDEKVAFVQSLIPEIENSEYIKMWNIYYLDNYTIKEFYNSKGAQIKHDFQWCGFSCRFYMTAEEGEKQFSESYQVGKTIFSDLMGKNEALKRHIQECEQFLLHSVAVEPGEYTLILAPAVTGVFAHECFGHKSESDFMIGDETSKQEWKLGKVVGSEKLSILDTGAMPGCGYAPFDDEGNRARVNYLIKNGVLAGRLHNADSAADLGEQVTGNGRAVNYQFEPIVRMTTTMIEKGEQSVESLIAETRDGILIKSIQHGSGLSTFTLAPLLAYTIKDGIVSQPVRISVVSGNVFEALGNIDGFSDEVEFMSFVTGGCGKMEQYPLSVGAGGPYIRVRKMQVQ